MPLSLRFARLDDVEAIGRLMNRPIATLQGGFLSPEQVRASHAVMGLDTQLIRDQTYLLAVRGEEIVGCGGWSFRATLFGGDGSVVQREPARLDPTVDAARIRAMYTHPAYVRQGIGRMILEFCERAAAAHGFRRFEMMATLAGEPLYGACDYVPVERVESQPIDGVPVPLVRMVKQPDA